MSSRVRFLGGWGAVRGLRESKDTLLDAALRVGGIVTGALVLLVPVCALGFRRFRRRALALAENEFGSDGAYVENRCVKPDVEFVVASGTPSQTLVNRVANLA